MLPRFKERGIDAFGELFQKELIHKLVFIFEIEIKRTLCNACQLDDLVYRRGLERTAARKERMRGIHKLRALLVLVFLNRRHRLASLLTAGHFLLRVILYYKNDC